MKQHDDDFMLVGSNYKLTTSHSIKGNNSSIVVQLKHKPTIAIIVLFLIVMGCLFAPLIINHDPAQFYLMNANQSPNQDFYFGTDTLGRDLFSIIWMGGRASLAIGGLSACIIAAIGIIYGSLSALAPRKIDAVMMRLVELLQSIPNLLILLLLSSMIGQKNCLTLALMIGFVGWFPLARLVRGEVKQIYQSEYICVAKRMGAGFFYLLRRHLIPNFLPAIMFMLISSISMSMLMESTLSFLGLGLPVEQISWGSMLALTNQAILLNSWWVIIFPGLFLLVTFFCITAIGQYFRQDVRAYKSYLS